MAGQTRCLAKVWQAGHLFLLLIPREHGHLVSNVIRGPKSWSGQRAKVVVTRLRSGRGNSKALGRTICPSHSPPAICTAKSFLGSEGESTQTLTFGGQGNQTGQVWYLQYFRRIHLPVCGECDFYSSHSHTLLTHCWLAAPPWPHPWNGLASKISSCLFWKTGPYEWVSAAHPILRSALTTKSVFPRKASRAGGHIHDMPTGVMPIGRYLTPKAEADCTLRKVMIVGGYAISSMCWGVTYCGSSEVPHG